MTLISRLEALTAPDSKIDIEIALANGWLYDKDEYAFPWCDPSGCFHMDPPRFTSLIDAAIPGEDIIGTSEQSCTPGQPVKWVAVHRMPKGRYGVSGTGHTEAIARRIAALKAKEDTK